ncbi:MAG: hypothetical protein A3G18_05720 [Rhodospirillales bacterium RIFCSPLOWO2_12_FULL_58_28]|nr:MAG: hypothetical protein A3H92_00025 [Rhodospirillales bacterium RIFCSPLOWO2_02_FULL_58_16]OHC79283.1 MAG: hypothetical protein A3G18_05720 [Rhodospirillales bacterium RIFCSPLOWO2_12_FULL_58_28]
MQFDLTNDGKRRELTLRGRLTFSDHESFRKITAGMAESGANSCSINLSGLEFIDSAGLGLLLLVNEAAQENHVKVSIRGAREQVKKMLEITKFSEVIPIE